MTRHHAALVASALFIVAPPTAPTSAVAGTGAQQFAAIDLTALIGTAGVSGYEDAVRELVVSSLPEWSSPVIDSFGNVTMTVGAGNPHVLIAAGLDEPGWVISDIDAQGYARLHRQTPASGTLFDQFLLGRPVLVQTGSGTAVPGVSATPSTHLVGDGPRSSSGRIRTINDLWLDFGADSRQQVADLGVRLMDPVSPRERVQTLSGRRVAGVAAQARGTVAALLAVAVGQARGQALEGAVTLAWTAESVSRQRGLQVLARRLAVDRVLLLTTTTAVATEPSGATGKLGRGPLIVDDDDLIATTAGSAGITTQALASEQFSPVGGASRIWAQAPIHRLSIPVRYAATPVEIVAAADVDALASLLATATGLAAPARVLLSATQPPASPEIELTGSFGALERLIETYGASGHEGAVREAIIEMLPDWVEPRVDQAGNLVLAVGNGTRRLAFVAHIDEVGYEVVEIAADGTVGLRPLGGFLHAVYEASPALIHTAAGPIAATFAPRAGYLEAKTLDPPRPVGARADVGTDTAAATRALGVAVGDSVTVRKRFQRLAGHRGTGRSVDDRVGSAALVLALKRIDPRAIGDRQLAFAWSTQEEVGLVGARVLAEQLRPEVVFAVDTFVSSDSPVDWQRRANVPLGSGLIARVLDNNHVSPRSAVDRLLAIATAHGIPIIPGSTGGGTDAGAFVEWGSVPMPLSWPARYSHSPVEVMDQRDLDALVELIVALAYEY